MNESNFMKQYIKRIKIIKECVNITIPLNVPVTTKFALNVKNLSTEVTLINYILRSHAGLVSRLVAFIVNS